jgi:hypothetical protein
MILLHRFSVLVLWFSILFRFDNSFFIVNTYDKYVYSSVVFGWIVETECEWRWSSYSSPYLIYVLIDLTEEHTTVRAFVVHIDDDDRLTTRVDWSLQQDYDVLLFETIAAPLKNIIFNLVDMLSPT